jgi:hypothetical protein
VLQALFLRTSWWSSKEERQNQERNQQEVVETDTPLKSALARTAGVKPPEEHGGEMRVQPDRWTPPIRRRVNGQAVGSKPAEEVILAELLKFRVYRCRQHLRISRKVEKTGCHHPSTEKESS